MLFPENPEKRPELWDSIRLQINRESMCYLVSAGKENANGIATVVSELFQDNILRRMKRSQICRISASRGVAIAPHFAASLDGSMASVTELIALPCDGIQTVTAERLRRYLEIAVINLLYVGGNVSEVFVPISIPPWKMADADIQSLPTGVVFRKKA